MHENNKILIIGNGPSTRELAERGFDNLPSDVDTFGMGVAYRFYRKVLWWPTYYALADSKVVFSHRHELARVVEDQQVSTERFYFSWPVSANPRFELIDHSSTGDFCFEKSLELGYREIYLIGIEGHYVERLPESHPLSPEDYSRLEFDQLGLSDGLKESLRIISRTPDDNPNYFFFGYQQAGDVYSLPRSDRHRERWTDAAALADSEQATVLNLSERSKIEDFPKSAMLTVFDHVPGKPTEEATETGPHPPDTPSCWYGPFARDRRRRIEEAAVVLEIFDSSMNPPADRRPTMVDVGACRGGAFREFAERRWMVHAFEPNPPLFADLLEAFDSPNVVINGVAVSDVAGEKVPFYTSEESLGISSLRPFRPSHELAAQVETIRLDGYLQENDVDGIEFLKIDTEGFDFMVLKGLDLTQHPVDVILCEFEDRKTKPLGYSMHDMAAYLQSFGYTVYVSEWHPVIRYGGPHQWRALKQYPCELEDLNAWGNLLAFTTDPGIWALTVALKNSMQNFDDRRAAKMRHVRRYSGIEAGQAKASGQIADATDRVVSLVRAPAASGEEWAATRGLVSALADTTSEKTALAIGLPDIDVLRPVITAGWRVVIWEPDDRKRAAWAMAEIDGIDGVSFDGSSIRSGERNTHDDEAPRWRPGTPDLAEVHSIAPLGLLLCGSPSVVREFENSPSLPASILMFLPGAPGTLDNNLDVHLDDLGYILADSAVEYPVDRPGAEPVRVMAASRALATKP
jgi:FkbM family methyltransferase